MRARARELARIAGLTLPSRARALTAFGVTLLFEIIAMAVRAYTGWQPLPLAMHPLQLVADALAAAVAVELVLRGMLQGALPWFGSGALLSLLVPAAVEYAAGYTGGEVLWEAAFGAGYVFARIAGASVYPCMAVRFVQYMLVPAFAAAVHR